MGYLNENIDSASKSLGQAARVELEYNVALKVPANFTAVCITTQNNSVLTVENLSATFDATFVVDPSPNGGASSFITIKANDRTPYRAIHNWNGSQLKIMNVSQESATIKVQIVDQG